MVRLKRYLGVLGNGHRQHILEFLAQIRDAVGARWLVLGAVNGGGVMCNRQSHVQEGGSAVSCPVKSLGKHAEPSKGKSEARAGLQSRQQR